MDNPFVVCIPWRIVYLGMKTETIRFKTSYRPQRKSKHMTIMISALQDVNVSKFAK